MQPNQQNPSPQNPTPTPSGQPGQSYPVVPDYLGLEPIPEPKPAKPPKKRIYIVAAIAIAALIVGLVGYLLISMQQSGPERRLTAMLETMLSQQYVLREHRVGIDDTIITSNTVESDLSNPKIPSSSIKHFSAVNDVNGTKQELRGDIVLRGDQRYARFAAIPDIFKLKNTELNTWYSTTDLPESQKVVKSIANNLQNTLNTPLGLIVIGEFDDALKAQIMNDISSLQPYVIQKDGTDTVDGEAMTILDIKIDLHKIGEINSNIAKSLGLNDTSIPYASINAGTMGEVSVWIDRDNRLRKIVLQEDEAGAGNIVTDTTSYSYPESLKIEIPTIGDGQ